MKEKIIFNEVKIAYNDEFREMDNAELKTYFRDNLERWGIRNPAQHVLVSVSKKKLGFLTSMLSDTKSMIRGAEGYSKRSLLNYRKIDEAPVWIDGEQAERLRFSYTAVETDGSPTNIQQTCELLVIKVKKTVFSVYFCYRNENTEEAKAQFDVILQSLRFIKERIS